MFFIQCCQELAVKRLSAFPWAQGCISRQPTKERQIMGRRWKLARNSGIRSIWFWLFIRTSLSAVILDVDPRAFISISVIIGATIYQNSQRVLSLYLNQCQVVSCQPEPTAKSEIRSIILQLVHSIHFNKSTYSCCWIESCAVLCYFVSLSFLMKWKRFY